MGWHINYLNGTTHWLEKYEIKNLNINSEIAIVINYKGNISTHFNYTCLETIFKNNVWM